MAGSKPLSNFDYDANAKTRQGSKDPLRGSSSNNGSTPDLRLLENGRESGVNSFPTNAKGGAGSSFSLDKIEGGVLRVCIWNCLIKENRVLNGGGQGEDPKGGIMETNILYYGDNLHVLRRYIPDSSIDLIYLDPPFNSQATYNILFKEPTGKPSEAQVRAFEDTWRWTHETERTLREIADVAPANVVNLINALLQALGRNEITAYLVMMTIRLQELHRVLKNTGSLYLHCDYRVSHYLKLILDQVFRPFNFRNEIVWCYARPAAPRQKIFCRAHEIIFFYTKSDNYKFNPDAIRLPYKESTRKRAGYMSSAHGRKFVREIHQGGKFPEDWWEIPYLRPNARENLGYETQKPEALLERIIKASSEEGDVILDPFCGCGTALVVAHRLGRRWVGIDITHLAINIMKWRLEKTFPSIQYGVVGEPVDLAGARVLAEQDRFQFQCWALSLIGARPKGKVRGADEGVDGYCYFVDERDKARKAVVQVKSGRASVRDVRDLSGVMDREGAPIGILLTLEKPTGPMLREAGAKGLYRSPLGRDYPRIQILTIEECLAGRKPDIPSWVSPFPALRKRRRKEYPKRLI